MEDNIRLPCIVTAYIDLSDKISTKNPDTYLGFFSNLLELKNEIVVFYDESIEKKIKYLAKDKSNIILIKINKDFLNKNILSYSYLERQREILNSEFFKNIKKLRLDKGETPEVNIPEYNIINYSKIDFLNYVVDNKIIDQEYVCWLDFALIKNKDFIPRDKKFYPEIFYKNKDQVHLIASSKIAERWHTDNQWYKLFIDIWEKVHGGLLFSHKDNLKNVKDIIHNEIQSLLSNNIIDDDQVIYFRAKLNNNNLFMFHRFWSQGYDYIDKFIQIKDRTEDYLVI